MANIGRPTRGTAHQRKAETRSRLQSAAVELAMENGLSATTTSDIAARADVSESTLFRHFGTKAAIIQHDTVIESIVEAIEQVPAKQPVSVALELAVERVLDESGDAEWTFERRRRQIATVETLAGSFDTSAQATRMMRNLRARTGRSVSKSHVKTFVGFLFAGIGLVELSDEGTRETRGAQLHEVVDLALNGVPL